MALISALTSKAGDIPANTVYIINADNSVTKTVITPSQQYDPHQIAIANVVDYTNCTIETVPGAGTTNTIGLGIKKDGGYAVLVGGTNNITDVVCIAFASYASESYKHKFAFS